MFLLKWDQPSWCGDKARQGILFHWLKQSGYANAYEDFLRVPSTMTVMSECVYEICYHS